MVVAAVPPEFTYSTGIAAELTAPNEQVERASHAGREETQRDVIIALAQVFRHETQPCYVEGELRLERPIQHLPATCYRSGCLPAGFRSEVIADRWLANPAIPNGVRDHD
jgi:hypothetical protein